MEGEVRARSKQYLVRKSPRQSFAARRRQNKMKFRFFSGHVPEKKHFSARKRASKASATPRAASSSKKCKHFFEMWRLCRHVKKLRPVLKTGRSFSCMAMAQAWATTLTARTPRLPRGSGSVSKVTF